MVIVVLFRDFAAVYVYREKYVFYASLAPATETCILCHRGSNQDPWFSMYWDISPLPLQRGGLCEAHRMSDADDTDDDAHDDEDDDGR